MKILLVTDGTEFSDYAIEKVLAMGLCNQNEIKILSVVNFPVPIGLDPIGGMASYPEMEKTQKDYAEKIVAEAAEMIRREQPAMFISTEVTVGAPESRIVDIAEEWQADLIVVGSHGYNTWERLLLGSVSSAVVHHAPCSVLVARRSKAEK